MYIINVLILLIVDKHFLKLYTLNMETEEIDLMVAENQVAFDFDSLDKIEEEESTSLPETLIKSVNHDYIKDEVLFVVARVYNKDLVKDFPYLKICGKKMIDWVLMAGSECEQKIIDDSENIIEKVKTINTNKPIIAVFYSDTPLLDKITFNKIIDYFSSKGMNFLQLSRGFVAKTEYLKNMSELIQGTLSNSFDEKKLLQVDSAKMINYVSNLLYNKIINYHIRNGVIIYGQNTVFIDADTEIESGVVIYPNNVIEGISIIEKGAVLYSGNIIKDSIIGSDSVINRSYIEKSKINKGVVVKPNSLIINQEV